MQPSPEHPTPEQLASTLLHWYAGNARTLPWRAAPGQRPDPYRVWLSEIMLQQTTVATVARRFEAFVHRWPTVQALAAADLQEVLAAWAGLGYYARARNLHRCAQMVASELNGRFPQTPAELQRLPGIGPYTAAAIAAIAFAHPAVAMDTNAERVLARLFAVTDPLPGCKPRLVSLAEHMLPRQAPGDFAQALMDLGALVCTARSPACHRCPLQHACRARTQGCAEQLPRRQPRGSRPVRQGEAFCIVTADGHVLLRRRPPRGLLGGMPELPSCGWDGRPDAFDPRQPCGLPRASFARAGKVRHTFTHFHLDLVLWRLHRPLPAPLPAAVLPEDCFWHPLDEVDRIGLPTLFRKAANLLWRSRT